MAYLNGQEAIIPTSGHTIVPSATSRLTVNFPYLSKGTFTTGPVALQVHRGDERAASAIYRSWFDQHFPIKRPRSWLRQENAWQSIILSNGEDAVVHRFDELPKLAADAKKYDITTFEPKSTCWESGRTCLPDLYT